jgi:hypothetical protein
MSSGALVQIIAYGVQDIYLMGQPQMTYWKTIYKRYSNYALESVEIPISGTISTGSKVSITIPKSGDLLKRLWIHYNPSLLIPEGNPTNVEYICSDLGHALIDKMELEIGGQIIDTQYGKWLSIWRDLTQPNPYSSAGLISDLYPNYSSGNGTLTFSSTSYQYGNLWYMTTQGEEPTTYYPFITTTKPPLVINSTSVVTANSQSIVIINNNSTAGGNFINANVSSADPSGITTIPIQTKLQNNYTNKYDIMAYTHIGTQNINQYYSPGVTISSLNLSTKNAPTEAYVPLEFWFCKNPGLAIPLIALQYHEVKLNLTFANSSSWVTPLQGTTVKTDISSISIFADYVYLDSIERKNFAQNAHEYLIDQVQLQTINKDGTSNQQASFELNFNHPVKELIITGNPEYYVINNPYNPTYTSSFIPSATYKRGRTAGGATPAPIISSTEYPNDYGCPVGQTNTKMTLTFNGTERFSPRNMKYFTREQIYEHHTGGGGHYFTDDIAVYSFAMRPQELQPSGTCNFSRIDRVQLKFTDINTLSDATETLKPLDVYAVNQNVLRVMSGMGGLAYSN